MGLPCGYSLSDYRQGFENAWARLEFAAGDFDSEHEARDYFTAKYMRDWKRLTEDAQFLLNEKGDVIGSCIAWNDDRQGVPVASLHWLIVDDKHRGWGFGRALCTAVMNAFATQNRLPVYIHTQPWSWKAIMLYTSLGFRIQKRDTFSHYINEYGKTMNVLRTCLSSVNFRLLSYVAE